MRNFAQKNAWQTISHCGIKLAIYRVELFFCIPQIHVHMAQAIRLHLCRPLPLVGLRKQVVLTDMYYFLYKDLGYWAYMMRLADGGRILLSNSNIFGPRQGLSPSSSSNDRQERRPM